MTVTLEVYEDDHATLVGTIDPGQWTRVKVADVANLGGGGEIQLPNIVAEGDPNPALDLLTPGRVIRVVSDSVDVGAFALEQPATVVVSPQEESGEVTTVTGREPMAARFDKVRWFPDRGLGNLPFHPDRPLSFAADRLRDDDPDGPQGAWPFGVGQLPAYDTSNYFGRPTGYIDQAGPDGDGPHWIADRDSRVDYAPGGVIYFRQRVELDDETDVMFQAAFDDEGELWCDDVPVLRAEGVYKGGSVQSRVILSAGEHLIAGFVRNLNELRVGVVFAGWSVSDGLPDNLLFRSDESACRVLGFPDDPPGFTPTEVIRLGWDEAQDRGMLTDVTMGFISATDTDSQALTEVIDITVKAPADSLLTTCQMLAATYLDIAAKRDDLELQAWIRGTRGDDLSDTVAFSKGNCAEIRWGSDFAEAATVALVTVENEAAFEVVHPDEADLGRHEIALDFGKCSIPTARIWARRYLDEISYARRSIAVTLVPGVGPVPQVDFTVGDQVLLGDGATPFTWGGVPIVWGEDDTTDWGEVHRVHSIGLEVDAESVERWTVELDQPSLLYEERLANILKRQTPAAAGGRTVLPTPSTPSFPSQESGSEQVETWSTDATGTVVLRRNGTPITGASVTGTGAVTLTDDSDRQYGKGVDEIDFTVGGVAGFPAGWKPPEGRWLQHMRVVQETTGSTITVTYC